MDDEVLVAGLVEEALEDDVGIGGHDAERDRAGAHVVQQLRRAEGVEAALLAQQLGRRLHVAEAGGDVAPQGAHLGR